MADARGTTIRGLQLGVAASVDDATDGVAFDVSFRNVGASDFVLNLGSMFANGKVMFPDAVPALLPAKARSDS
jgi:hypothetical protein